MKLAISHIAWPPVKEDFYLERLKGYGCTGLEIAPNRLWPEPLEVGQKERLAFKRRVQACGLEIVALHALLYQRNDLGLFREPEVEARTISYLQGLCGLAADLGARVLVFGSPKSRRRGVLAFDEAMAQAGRFFFRIACTAAEEGVRLCIEPLGRGETDFISTAKEGLALVEMVDHPGFGLHLDAKAVAEEGKGFAEILRPVLHRVEHFHINDPELVEVNSTGYVDHLALGRALKKLGYHQYVSIEMRTLPEYPQAIERSVRLAKQAYIEA
jgi:D-psicose/D-tagatose/L-ribulose 3-epimerase